MYLLCFKNDLQNNHHVDKEAWFGYYSLESLLLFRADSLFRAQKFPQILIFESEVAQHRGLHGSVGRLQPCLPLPLHLPLAQNSAGPLRRVLLFYLARCTAVSLRSSWSARCSSERVRENTYLSSSPLKCVW